MAQRDLTFLGLSHFIGQSTKCWQTNHFYTAKEKLSVIFSHDYKNKKLIGLNFVKWNKTVEPLKPLIQRFS